MRTLRLTLKKQPFDVMVTGEKTTEYRAESDWIKSRLYEKDGSHRRYDIVEFVNGYGSHRPRFTAKFDGFLRINGVNASYSNGLEVKESGPMFAICLGEVTETYNLTQ